MSEQDLKDIKEQLEIIISLMVPTFSEDSYGLQKGTQLDVLKLCDLQYTQQEIASKIKKTKKAVARAIENLSARGLIKSIKKGNRTVYLRLK
ncbi:MAG: hypothetical protein KAT77_06530 [Nanoarchaeota archaeon]|nr:hypothetical protein [Nanoarchaeota archaeon]